MARIRILRPEIWDDPIIGQLSRDARLLLLAVNTFADDEGLLVWDADELAELAFTFDQGMGPVQVQALMDELTGRGIVFPYQGGVSQRVHGYVVGFSTSQKIDRPSLSKLPPPRIDSADALTMYMVRDGWVCYLCGRRINGATLPGAGAGEALDRGVARQLGGSSYPSSIRAAHLSCDATGVGRAADSGSAGELSRGVVAPGFLVEPLTEPLDESLSEDTVRVFGPGRPKTSTEPTATPPKGEPIPPLTCNDTQPNSLSEPPTEPLHEPSVSQSSSDSLRAHRGKGKERNGKEVESNGGSAAVTNPHPTTQTAETTETTSTNTASRRPSPAATPLSGTTRLMAPSKDMSEDGCTTKAGQDDRAAGIPVKAALNAPNPAIELNEHPGPAEIKTVAVIEAKYEPVKGDDPLEQESLFGDDPTFPKPPPPAPVLVKAVKPPNPHYPVAQEILKIWWRQFDTTQVLPYGRILKTVLTALERGLNPEAVTAAMMALGREAKPVTPGMLQMALSNLDKPGASGMGRAVGYVAPGLTDTPRYATSFE